MNLSLLSNISVVLCGYLLIINLITLVLFGYDKWSARGNLWRTRERTLLLLTALGGTIGAIAGMMWFRHKTKKTSFQFWFILIIVLQAAILAGLSFLTTQFISVWSV